MSFLMGAMAIGSLLSSHSQRKAQMKAQAADAELQRAKLERARVRQADDYTANTQRLREASQRRELAIESSKIEAESSFDTTFAGSGISGSTMNQMDAEINAEVTKNKYENKKALDVQLGDMAKDYVTGASDINEQSKAINTTAPKANVLGDIMDAASTAASASSGLTRLGSSFKSGFGTVSKWMGF